MGFFDRWVGKPIKLTDGEFWRGFFGLGTTSGETVDYEKALALDALWACTSLLSKTASTLPCIVYDKGGAEPATDNPLYELLHDLPNLDDTAVEFWSMAAMSLCLDGNFFAEKKTNSGRITALIPLHPLCVDVGRNSRNERVYTVKEDGKERTVGESGMFHVRGQRLPGCDRGMSPIGVVRNTLGNALAGEKMAGKMFANGFQVSGLLTSDQVLKPEQRKQLSDMLQQYSGSQLAGKVAVLEAGLKYQQLTINPQDAQMLETRKFSVEQICRIFGVPPIMIGHAAEGVTTWGSGVEQIILQFTKTGLRPMLKNIEAAIYRDLLDEKTRKEVKVEFNLEGLLRGDSAARASFYSTMVQNGIYSRNYARKLENLPPAAGGDELTAQTNLAPIGMLGAALAPQPAQPMAA
jgi:HK97 family phage portal protein